jgi:hypothetical protein
MTNYAEAVRRALKDRIDDYDGWGPNAATLLDLYALLAMTKGKQTTMQDIHDAWSLWTNHNDSEHRSLVPFSLLTAEIAEYDRPYMAAVHEVAGLLQEADNRALEWCREDAIIHRLHHDQAGFEDTKRRIFERLARE